MKYVFDLDGTICEQTTGGLAYTYAKPRRRMIDAIRKLHSEGHTIVINTARGMNTCLHEVEAMDRYCAITEAWLKNNGVPYDRLQFGKPAGDVYVDDRSVKPNEFLGSVDINDRYFFHNVEFGTQIVNDVPDLRETFSCDGIAMTNGCFDVFHAGHAECLAWMRDNYASDDTLIVIAINDDAGVKRLKGHGRPVNSLLDRVSLIGSFLPNAVVVAFGEETPLKLMELIRPNFVVKSEQYLIDDIVAPDDAMVVLAPHYKNLSTSNIVNKIRHV